MDLAVAGLMLGNDLVAEQLESGIVKQRRVGTVPERREVHRCAEPVVVDLLYRLAGPERAEQKAVRAQPAADPRCRSADC